MDEKVKKIGIFSICPTPRNHPFVNFPRLTDFVGNSIMNEGESRAKRMTTTFFMVFDRVSMVLNLPISTRSHRHICNTFYSGQSVNLQTHFIYYCSLWDMYVTKKIKTPWIISSLNFACIPWGKSVYICIWTVEQWNEILFL